MICGAELLDRLMGHCGLFLHVHLVSLSISVEYRRARDPVPRAGLSLVVAQHQWQVDVFVIGAGIKYAAVGAVDE